MKKKLLCLTNKQDVDEQYEFNDSKALEKWIISYAFLKGILIKLQCQQTRNACEFKKIWSRVKKIALKKNK